MEATESEIKPRLHLVKKVNSSIMSMQVEDEVEIMDDSEDELIVNRNSNMNRTYSKNSDEPHLYKINSDEEEEFSLSYEEDEPEIKQENGEVLEENFEQNGEDFEQNGENFEQDAERIMNKRSGRKPKMKENGSDSEDEKPLINRRRKVIKVVEDFSKPSEVEPDLSLDEVEISKENGTEIKIEPSEILNGSIEAENVQIEAENGQNSTENGQISAENDQNSAENGQNSAENDQSLDEIQQEQNEVDDHEIHFKKEEILPEKEESLQSLAESLVEDEEDTRSEISAEEDSLPSTFNLGDLVWSKVGAAVYWPSIVTIDPDTKSKFTHCKMHRSRGLKREYHVQFFGRIQRAWVISSNMLKFEGLEAFQELGKKVTHKNLKAAFIAKHPNKEIWTEAHLACAGLESKSSQERLEICAKLFKEGQKSQSKKRRRPSTEIEEPSQKRPKFEEAEKLIEAIPLKVLEENKRKLKTGFKLFQLAHKEETIKEHGEQNLDKVLSKKWSISSALEKKFYQDKAAHFMKGEKSEDLESEPEIIETPTKIAEKTSKNSRKSLVNKSGDKMIGIFRKENCCIICEEPPSEGNEIVKCRGICGGTSFHFTCLSPEEAEKAKNDEKWKCQECATNKHNCLLCKSSEGNVIRCSQAGCGRFYHVDCILKNGLWPQHRLAGDDTLICPVHTCHTCASDNPKDPYMKYNSKLVKCVRCPTAYHSGDYCVAAGTVQITANQIVCPKHYVPKESKKHQKKTNTHVSVSWCFICSKGGSLICCEQCPASFHAECLKIDPPDQYFCDNCETGRMPLYGEILWVKLGKYRWWPARVLHPSEVPSNIEKLAHEVGEFPIQFCGSKEYAWMNRGRCFLYEEGDSEKIPGIGSSSGGLDGSYSRGLSEAAELYEQYNEERQKRERNIAAKGRLNSNAKPPMFNKIKSNRPFGDCPVYSIDPTDKQICECDPKSSKPCGADSDCINRLLMTECRMSTCRAGENCNNQRFQRRIYPPLKVMRTPTRGWGLFVMSDVKKGDFLIEYVGELITMDEFRRRIQLSIDRKEEQNYYYMTMDSQRMLDAGPRGNIARFMNHSCDPNAETQKWTVNGDTRVGLFAMEDVKAGHELTFNYQFESMGEQKKHCLCGAKNCSGFIGEKVHKNDKSRSNGELKKSKKVAKKVKTVPKITKVWEDLCFRCFDDGEVLMCDWKNCPKVYHLSCLGKDKMPREKWYCPWHHCVECGKTAIGHCIHCPNAYCKSHNNALKIHDELGTICDEHKDDIPDLILFYRQVGGIDHLVPNPNVAISEIPARLQRLENSTQESPRNEEKRKKKKRIDKENFEENTEVLEEKNSDTPFGQRNPFQYKCKIDGCQFRTRRTRLFVHYVNTHKLSEAEAEELVPPKLISNEKDSQRLTCPLCDHRCVPIMLRKHLFRTHREDLTMEEINLVFEEAVKTKTNKIAVTQQEAAEAETELEKNPLFSKVQPDGRVACKAPECKMMVSAQNISRHWNQYHPKLKKDDYQPSLRKLMRLLSQNEPQNEDFQPPPSKKLKESSKLKCGTNNCDFKTLSKLKMSEHRKTLGHTSPCKKIRNSLTPSKLPLIPCGICEFETRYHSNLVRHRRRRNHYQNDTEISEAKQEEIRDELAKKIEETKNTESENSDSEDVTIELSKSYSPSKITDYFKPISKKNSAKKSLNMDTEETDNNKKEDFVKSKTSNAVLEQ